MNPQRYSLCTAHKLSSQHTLGPHLLLVGQHSLSPAIEMPSPCSRSIPAAMSSPVPEDPIASLDNLPARRFTSTQQRPVAKVPPELPLQHLTVTRASLSIISGYCENLHPGKGGFFAGGFCEHSHTAVTTRTPPASPCLPRLLLTHRQACASTPTRPTC